MQIVAAAAMLGFCAHLVVLLRPERHQAFIARNATVTRRLTGISPVTFARSAVPATSMCLLALSWAFLPSSTSLAVALGPLAALLGAACLTLVVSLTGRPRVLVLRPCRQASAPQVAAWLTPHPSAGVVGGRRRP